MSGSQDEMNFEASGEESKKTKMETPTISKTLHVRNLPPDTTEQDLIALACPFGRVVNVLLLKGKSQALIQMQDIQNTVSMTQYYNSVRAHVRGRPIYFQYSNREEITSSQGAPEQQNNVLLVTILNVLFPIDIDVLNRVFSKYGTILKIVIFNKTGFQSLIQYADLQSAVAARMELDGQNIYSGCCTLRIQYSSLSNLNVKYNNEKSRDFSNPNLPSTPPNSMPSTSLLSGAPDSSIYSGNWMGSNPMGGYNQYYPGASQPGVGKNLSNPMANVPLTAAGSLGTSVLIVSGLDTERVLLDSLFTLFGVYGDVIRIKILHNKRDTALVQFVNAQQAETALNHLNGCPFYGHTLRVNFSKHNTISLPRPSSGTEADAAGANLTKDYTGSTLHRYKVVGSRNYQHICPPSTVLHLSNIPENTSEDLVRQLFAQSGTVVGFRFFQKDRRMGLVQMASVAEAVTALINVHNYVLEGSNLRCSFSKSSL